MFQSLGLIIGLVTLLPFVGMIILFVWLAAKGKKQSNTTQSWSETTGKVLRSEIITTRSDGNNDGFHETSYSPSILYEYTVGKQKYTSDQFQMGLVVGWRTVTQAEQKVNQYFVGKKISVFYDSSNPSQAVLDKNPSAATSIFKWVAFLIAVVLLLVVAMMSGIFYFINKVAF